MKVVPLSEAKAKLSRYAMLCHDEPVVVTVNGKPSSQLVPFEESDDLIDQLIDQHLGFRDLLEARLHERNLSVANGGTPARAPSAQAGEEKRTLEQQMSTGFDRLVQPPSTRAAMD